MLEDVRGEFVRCPEFAGVHSVRRFLLPAPSVMPPCFAWQHDSSPTLTRRGALVRYYLFLLQLRNRLDLAQDVLGQGFDGAAAPGRLAGEVFGVDLVEGGKIGHVGNEAGGLDDLRQV